MRIVAEQLKFTYNAGSALEGDALKGVSVEIPDGAFFGIIGHTGSGKSTFIAHLNGLNEVQSGKIWVGEVPLYNLKERKTEIRTLKKRKKTMSAEAYTAALGALPCDKKRLKNDRIALREKVGMVFQYPEYQLFAETVEEDVAFALKNFAAKRKKLDASFVPPTAEEVASAVRSAMECVGLDYEIYRKKSPFDLSGGQKRRVAIAGVIVAKPDVLVLDEPVAGLDPEGKAALFDLLHALHKNTIKTVVIVSHDMDDVAEHCTEAAVFEDGIITRKGDVKSLFSDGAYLKSVGLDVPLSATLSEKLKEIGVEISTDYTEKDFVEKVAAAYRQCAGAGHGNSGAGNKNAGSVSQSEEGRSQNTGDCTPQSAAGSAPQTPSGEKNGNSAPQNPSEGENRHA